MTITTRKFLEKLTLTREMVDRFLDPDTSNWAAFDEELGYRLRDNVLKDGVDGNYTITRPSPSGERRILNFAGLPCRINTYGNSFTQCNQVSDGETWQEYLAAHFGESIRNFGVGGYGVFQAYRRMLIEERTDQSAEYVIINIYSDDHFRNIVKWPWLRYTDDKRNLQMRPVTRTQAFEFHYVPWSHLRLNPTTGNFDECENPNSSPESLYLLTDKEYVYETFKDDFEFQATMAQRHTPDIQTSVLQEIADALKIPTDFSSSDAISRTAQALMLTCGLRSSMYVIDKARTFAQVEGKELLILLSHSTQDVADACSDHPRFDQEFLHYIRDNGLPVVDVLPEHVTEFKSFARSPKEYVQRYYVGAGHYNPRGNHFFAFAVKDVIVEWLDPPPPTYSSNEAASQGLLTTR